MGLAICKERSATELRAYARRAWNPRAAARAYALANALEGMTRAEAARLAGMERQALRDAVLRYNAEGLAGLEDRPKPGLTEGEQAALASIILRGPDPERDGISAYTREDLARIIAERFDRRYHPSSLSGALRRVGFSAEDPTQPSPLRSGGPDALGKKGLPDALSAITAAHPGKRIALWFQDEARVGQKGRTCHVWWLRGQRPPGIADKRFSFAYVFAAVEPSTGQSRTCTPPWL